MAEGGIIQRLFGGGEEGEAEGEAVGAALDPVASAVAIDAARFDPELSRKAGEYLDEQKHLVRIQTEHLHEQRAVQLDHLKLRRVGERMRVTIQSFFVALGALIGVGFLSMVWSAATDHGLVVEAFSVPPDLVGRGLTGQVVAKQVLDHLTDLQDATESARAPDTYRNNWGEDLKVEIPETGVSIGDLSHVLRDMLGHETRITGEVYRTPAGLTVTARAGEQAAKGFSGTDADLDKMIEQAAEEVYRRTQPYRYAGYLRSHGRAAEAIAVYRELATSPNATERAWAHVGLGFTSHSAQAYADEERKALAEKPGFAMALADLTAAEHTLEHEAGTVSASRQLLRDKKGIEHDIAKPERETLIALSAVYADIYSGDLKKARDDIEKPSNVPEALISEIEGAKANLSLYEHDTDAVRRQLGHFPPSVQLNGLAALSSLNGDPTAVELWRRVVAADQRSAYDSDYVGRNDTPWLAIALAQGGAAKEAEAVSDSMPLDCDLCLRSRGIVASLAGDRIGAERWFKQAIARTPDLPWAYVARGQARFRTGDLDGALADARAAARVSPHFADSYALWGDVLARRRLWSQARDRYDRALRYAPAWAAAHRARDEVARRASTHS